MFRRRVIFVSHLNWREIAKTKCRLGVASGQAGPPAGLLVIFG
jgi:hypothetical protein